MKKTTLVTFCRYFWVPVKVKNMSLETSQYTIVLQCNGVCNGKFAQMPLSFTRRSPLNCQQALNF